MGFSEGPDRGHAWVIACTACVIVMILSGISKVNGILYVAVIDTYGVSRQQATLPFTFRKSLRSLAGPVVGILGQRFGIRAVTLFGSIIAALGAALCFLAPSVEWLTFFWGGVHGLGDCFANTLFQVIVNQYFVKYRSTASGIALSGACVGGVLFSFLVEGLRDSFGLQGTFLILAGIVLHVFPAAILLKPPSWVKRGIQPNTEKKLENVKSKKPGIDMVSIEYSKSNGQKKSSITSINPHLMEKNSIPNNSNPPSKTQSTANLVAAMEKKLEGDGCDNLAYSMENKSLEKPPMEKRLSIQNIFDTPSKEGLYEKAPSNHDLSREASLKKTVTKQREEKKVNETKNPSLLESVKTIGRLYVNPMFLLIGACMATYVFIFVPITTCMVDYGKDKGLPESVGKFMVHGMAAGDIIGRLCFGWVTDKELVTIPRYITISLVLQGVFIILLPFTSSLASYLTLLAFYSMMTGSMLVRLPVFLLKHVKKEEQSVAMGCYGFVSGLVPFGTPYVIGHFRDHSGSYDGMYFLLGSLSILNGAFWLLEPVLVRLKQRLDERRANDIGKV